MPNSLLTVTLASNFGTFLLYGLSCVICFVAYHKHPNFSIIRHLAIPIFGLVANLACMAFYLVGPFMGTAQRWSHCWRWGSPPSGRSTAAFTSRVPARSRPYYTGDESSGSLTPSFRQERYDPGGADQCRPDPFLCWNRIRASLGLWPGPRSQRGLLGCFAPEAEAEARTLGICSRWRMAWAARDGEVASKLR